MKKVMCNVQNNFNRFVMTHPQAKEWLKVNNIPEYINASYLGGTGATHIHFPTSINGSLPDITSTLTDFETEVIQNISDTMKKPFGYIRTLHKFLKNFGTGAPWDTKFSPFFPGRDSLGQKQYAIYKNEAVSGNDISNIFYAHMCKYIKLPKFMAKLCAKLDANGVLEILSKNRLPNKQLRHFKDTDLDQMAINKGYKDFDIRKYKIK